MYYRVCTGEKRSLDAEHRGINYFQVYILEGNRKLLIIFSEALGKVSPKIRRLRRLWREGFPERQFSRS